MADDIERMLDLIQESGRDWPDEPMIDLVRWRRLAVLAEENGMPSAAAGCLAAAGGWPEHRGWFGVREDFEASINGIGKKHGLPSLPDHLDVCISMHLLVRTLPAHVETKDAVVSAEQGATSWRDFRRKAPGWMSRIGRSEPAFLYLLALELHSDHTSFAAANLAGVRKRLTALVLGMESIIASAPDRDITCERDELRAILECMTKIGSPKGGRHSHGKRRRDCAALAKEFWKEQLGREPSIAFVPDPTTSPSSPFAKWFCDAMEYIDGWSVVTCREVLRMRSRKK